MNYVYIFIPLYYLSKTNEDGEVVPFIGEKEYLIAIEEYNSVFELFNNQIKVTKTGYYDQVKRYNVRQAIDQQEISGFFELVKKDQ